MREIVACLLVMGLAIPPVWAATYEKASDTQVKVIDTIATEETLTLDQIDHEIEGIDLDMGRITVSYNQQMDGFQARKDKYVAMKNAAEGLGITKPIIIDKIEEPITDIVPNGDPVVEPEHTI